MAVGVRRARDRGVACAVAEADLATVELAELAVAARAAAGRAPAAVAAAGSVAAGRAAAKFAGSQHVAPEPARTEFTTVSNRPVASHAAAELAKPAPDIAKLATDSAAPRSATTRTPLNR